LEERANLVWRGRRLEYFTIAWNSPEGLVATLSGLIAGNIVYLSAILLAGGFAVR
jgi:hypothetical protein